MHLANEPVIIIIIIIIIIIMVDSYIDFKMST